MANEASSSYGMIGKETVICQSVYRLAYKGLWYVDNPLRMPTSLLILQIFLIFVVSRITYILLRPFRQTMITAQIVAGIIMGPSFLGKNKAYYHTLFPLEGKLVITTFAEFGIMIYFFKAGVQVNPRQVLNIGRDAVVIGIVGYGVSLALGIVAFKIVEYVAPIPKELEHSVMFLVTSGALTSFVVLSDFLREMNILNSEIGRLALSCAMISDGCGWFMYFVVSSIARSIQILSYRPIMELVMSVFYFSIVFFCFRPMVIRISKRNPEGKPLTESQFLAIICMLLFIVLSAQVVGQQAFFGAFMFGLILPDGPPLGSVLTERLDSIASALLLPVYCVISGLKTDASTLLAASDTLKIEFIMISGYIGKFIGTILPSLYFQVHMRDSFALALIMCCKGILELCLYNVIYNAKVTAKQPFTIQIFNLVVVTGLITPIVHYISDPSRKYRSYVRKAIIDSRKDRELRILACIYTEENVYPMINLLQASNPTNDKPLSVFVIQLMELTGRAASVLRKNKITTNSFSKMTSSQHIANVFNQFEQQNKGGITVQHFTAIAPYATMHEDICTIAMDKRTNIVIVPFHRQWTADGNSEVSHPLIRTVNQNVLKRVPCSVGILIDRSRMTGKLLVISENLYYKIAVIFLGGDDDQEALAYGMHMVEHAHIILTVLCITSERDNKIIDKKKRDCGLLEYVKASAMNRGDVSQVIFNEEFVQDGAGTTEVIRKMESKFDMVIVGRHQDAGSSCTLGLTEWSEYPELGPIGDLLATSDFRFSVLVVQQQFSRYDSCDNSFIK